MRTKWIAALSLVGVFGAAAAAGAVNSAVLGAAAPVDDGRNSALKITEHNWPDSESATVVPSVAPTRDDPAAGTSGQQEPVVESDSGSVSGAGGYPSRTKPSPGKGGGGGSRDDSERQRPTSDDDATDDDDAEPTEKSRIPEDTEDPPDNHADEDTPEARSSEEARSDRDPL